MNGGKSLDGQLIYALCFKIMERTRVIFNENVILEFLQSCSHRGLSSQRKSSLFRDGVSEGQFDMVLNKESSDLKNVVCNHTYQPKITLVVAQKRHPTQLFLDNMADGGATGNVPLGTVVDTKIVHPFEFDFYPCSHYGRIGTRNCQEHSVRLDGYFSPSHVSEASGWLNLLLIFDPFA